MLLSIYDAVILINDRMKPDIRIVADVGERSSCLMGSRNECLRQRRVSKVIEVY